MLSRTLFLGALFLGVVLQAHAQTRAEVVNENTLPVGQVEVAGAAQAAAAAAAAGAAPASPEDLYKKNCAFCHDTGAAGAPKYADKAGWAVHLAKGNDVLKEHALKGFKAMPAKGLCPQCSDADTIAALDYLLKSVQ
jgi:cytochrome c5